VIGHVRLVGAIAIVRVPIYARLVRGSVLAIKQQEYVEAARALGLRGPRILSGHVLPNSLAPIIVTTTLGIATAIIVEATLSFLGLGTQPPTPSWGWDLKANVAFIQANAWLALFPGAAILITVLGFNLARGRASGRLRSASQVAVHRLCPLLAEPGDKNRERQTLVAVLYGSSLSEVIAERWRVGHRGERQSRS
jgi:ABC-type dipeptide/oligopeptide/nickel transport system permease subunit